MWVTRLWLTQCKRCYCISTVFFSYLSWRDGCALPELAVKNDIMVGFYTSQVQPKDMTALNYVECMLEFKERIHIVDVKRSLEGMEN